MTGIFLLLSNFILSTGAMTTGDHLRYENNIETIKQVVAYNDKKYPARMNYCNILGPLKYNAKREMIVFGSRCFKKGTDYPTKTAYHIPSKSWIRLRR